MTDITELDSVILYISHCGDCRCCSPLRYASRNQDARPSLPEAAAHKGVNANHLKTGQHPPDH